jgi:quercetin dioxygenase-like cupin family protein
MHFQKFIRPMKQLKINLSILFLLIVNINVHAQKMEKASILNGKHQPLAESKGKVLFEKEGQKVIYKTFQKDEMMPSHTNSKSVFVVIVSGKMKITVENEIATFEAGDCVIFPAELNHELLCLEKAKILIYK